MTTATLVVAGFVAAIAGLIYLFASQSFWVSLCFLAVSGLATGVVVFAASLRCKRPDAAIQTEIEDDLVALDEMDQSENCASGNQSRK